MTQSRWREYAPSNAPDTCLWCGAKLKHAPIVTRVPKGEAIQNGYALPKGAEKRGENFPLLVTTGHEEKGGLHGDGFFCNERCGYLFGKAFAQFGRRLAPIEKQEPKEERDPYEIP